MNKNGEMNKITHEGNDYEVLPLDRISEITHAKLAGGKVVAANVDYHSILIDPVIAGIGYTVLHQLELEQYGIQPLKLLPKVPVEFTATAEPGISFSYIQAPFDCANKTFKCVEVTE